MHGKKLIPVMMSVVLILVTIGVAVTYRLVSAQASTPTQVTPVPGDRIGQPGPGLGMRGARYSEQDLADALGISLDKLQSAEQTANSEVLMQAVSAGLITQSQADQFTQGNPDGRPAGRVPFLKGSTIDYDSLLAQALGISTDQLQAAKKQAYFASLDQSVTDGNLTQDQAAAAKGAYLLSTDSNFQAAMKSAYESAVNQAVSDGAISQSQADQLLKNATGMVWGGFDFPGGLAGMHGRGGPDFNGGTPPGNPPAGAPTSAPSNNN
jgi:hypothetical protein